MKKLIVAAVVVILLIGAALVAAPVIENRAAAQIKSDIERDGTTTVRKVEVGLLGRRILLTDIRSRQAAEITIGRWHASGVAWPLGELIKGRTPFNGIRAGDPLQAARVELNDIHGTGGRGSWSIASLVIDDFDLGRYDPPPIDSPNASVHLVARALGTLSMSRLEQKGTSLTDSRGDKVTIASVSLGRVERGLVSSAAVAGVEVTRKNDRAPFIQVSDGKLEKLDMRRALSIMADAAWRPGRPIGRVELDSASVSGFGGEALTRYGISLGSISTETKHEGKDVKRSSMRIRGFVLAPPLRGLETLQLRIGLQAMGLKDLRLDLDCGGTEDRAKAELSVDSCVLTGADLGEVNLAAKFVGADAAFWRAVDDGDTFALLRSKAGLSAASLVVVDRGLVERSLRAVATTTGRPVAAVRAGFAQEVRRFQPPGVLITEDMTKLLDTVARFIESGGTLTFNAKPSTPIGMDRLDYFRRPGPDLVDVLGLSATLSR